MSARATWLLMIVMSVTVSYGKCKSGIKSINIATTTPATGDTISGPCTIEAKGLNVVRYDYNFSSSITFGNAVDFFSKLTSVSTGQDVNPTTHTPAPAGNDHVGTIDNAFAALNAMVKVQKKAAKVKTVLDDLLAAANSAMDDADQLLTQGDTRLTQVTQASDPLNSEVARYHQYQTLRAQAATATDVVAEGGDALSVFLSQSDSDLQSGGFPVLMNSVARLLAAGSSFISGIGAQWPDSANVSALRQSIEDSASDLQGACRDLPALRPTRTRRFRRNGKHSSA